VPEPAARSEQAAEPARPRRRRRRFGRRAKGVTLQTLLLPPEAGRQALVFAETREGCTELRRAVAADLSADSKGPDPVALLIDPSPEELADWKRDAPQAEIVSAGQPRHASDALAQAATRAGNGEDVILLVDSLTRLGEAHGDAEAAKEFFDAGREQGSQGGGSLTVVAALERPSD
jgi:transcription termination factor Rho